MGSGGWAGGVGAGRGAQFNRHVLEAEQAEYEREGVPWARVASRDLQPCLDVIEARGTGILSLLDGAAWGGGRGGARAGGAGGGLMPAGFRIDAGRVPD